MAANQEQYAALLPVVTGIVYHLNMTTTAGAWKLQPQGPECFPSFELVNGDAILYIRLESQHSSKPARLSIGGIVPRGKDGQFFKVYDRGASGTEWNEVTAPGITVAVSRDSETIAREITRRFLPQYLRVVGLALARIQETENYEQRRFSNLQACADVVGMTEEVRRPPYNRTRVVEREDFSYYTRPGCQGKRVEVHACESTVDLKIQGLTVEQARILLEHEFLAKGV